MYSDEVLLALKRASNQKVPNEDFAHLIHRERLIRNAIYNSNGILSLSEVTLLKFTENDSENIELMLKADPTWSIIIPVNLWINSNKASIYIDKCLNTNPYSGKNKNKNILSTPEFKQYLEAILTRPDLFKLFAMLLLNNPEIINHSTFTEVVSNDQFQMIIDNIVAGQYEDLIEELDNDFLEIISESEYTIQVSTYKHLLNVKNKFCLSKYIDSHFITGEMMINYAKEYPKHIGDILESLDHHRSDFKHLEDDIIIICMSLEPTSCYMGNIFNEYIIKEIIKLNVNIMPYIDSDHILFEKALEIAIKHHDVNEIRVNVNKFSPSNKLKAILNDKYFISEIIAESKDSGNEKLIISLLITAFNTTKDKFFLECLTMQYNSDIEAYVRNLPDNDYRQYIKLGENNK